MTRLSMMCSVLVSCAVWAQGGVSPATVGRGAGTPSPEARVEAELARRGISIGLCEESGRVVAVGTASATVDAPEGTKDFVKVRNDGRTNSFAKVRNDVAKCAFMHAKATLMQTLSSKMTAGRAVSTASAAGLRERVSASFIERFAAMELGGCEILAAEQGWSPGRKRFRAAVAVGIDMAAAEACKTAGPAALPELLSLDDDDPEWEAWCAKRDLTTSVGCRQFIDSKGRRRHLGIAVSSVEGLKGAQLRNAIRVAKLSAVSHLAFALYSDSVARKTAIRYRKEGSGDGQAVSWEKFTSEVMSKCSMAVPAHEVYSATVVDPLTGLQSYVSVCGTVEK